MSLWTRRAFIGTGVPALLAQKVIAKERSAMADYIIIGSTSKGEGAGIRVAKWNDNAGTLSDLRLGFAAQQPSFMCAVENHAGSLMFSGHQPTPSQAALSSFRVTPSGGLAVINTLTMPDLEESLIQIVVDRTHRCLVSASYRTSKVRSFHIATDGRLSGPVSEFHLHGSGPNPHRQAEAHAHGAVIAPGNNFALINDLGSDRIVVFKLNVATAEMAPNTPPYYAAPPGSGPRHTAFHPNGKWAYCVSELSSTLTLFDWDGVRGILSERQTISTLPSTRRAGADTTKNRAGEVIVDSSGRHLYSCNRGLFQELLTFRIGADGRLSLLERTPLNGEEARHFQISPSGRFVVVAEQFSDRVGVFRRDVDSGKLLATGTTYPAKMASCIVFVRA